jgi:hypothetical protein
MESGAFENVKNQIGRCGIWCGSCAVGNGTLRQLAKRCEHIVGCYDVDEWGAEGFDGKKFMKGLVSIQDLPLCVGCLKGGGNDECKIRPCVLGKRLSDCMECGDMKKCEHVEALQRVRIGALRVGMLAKAENDRGKQRQLIEKWSCNQGQMCTLWGVSLTLNVHRKGRMRF